MGEYRSGQTEQAVNLPPTGFSGSNPLSPIMCIWSLRGNKWGNEV